MLSFTDSLSCTHTGGKRLPVYPVGSDLYDPNSKFTTGILCNSWLTQIPHFFLYFRVIEVDIGKHQEIVVAVFVVYPLTLVFPSPTI